MNSAEAARGYSCWRLVSVGDPYVVDLRVDPRSARRSLGALVASSTTDVLSNISLTAQENLPLAGQVGENVLLRMPDRDRRPWWLLSPVFRGRIVSTGQSGAVLVGVMRTRVTTALVIHLFAAVVAFLLDVPLLGLGLVVGYWVEVVAALPRQARRLDVRIQSAVSRVDGTD